GAERCGDEVLDLAKEGLQLAGDLPKSFHYAVPLADDPLGDASDTVTDRIEASLDPLSPQGLREPFTDSFRGGLNRPPYGLPQVLAESGLSRQENDADSKRRDGG